MSVKDARIKCISGEAIISDLGLRLQRGDVTNIPEESAQNSKDLWRLERIGQVSIRCAYVAFSLTHKCQPRGNHSGWRPEAALVVS